MAKKKSQRTNSRKNSSRKTRKTAFGKLVSVLVVIFAVGYFLYKNVPQLHDFADAQIEKAKTAVAKYLPEANADANATKTAENSNANTNGTAISKSQDEDSKKEPQSQNPEKKSESGSAKNGFVSLPKNLEFPLCAGANHAADHERRNYEYYSICYRESYEQAEWSAYCLTSEHLVKNASRSDDFRPDPEISTGSATLADYKASGYDRGHLSPAADFAFDKGAMSETFYMSNMSPQAGSFNRGIWKDLESTVRDWAKKFGRVYVVSGPVLDKKASDYESIGKNKVSVPQYYYKVLLAPVYEDEADKETPEDAKNVTAIGFIFPNTKCAGTIFDYAVSVDEVEKRTGIDFFNELEDRTENAVEANFEKSVWE